MSPRAEADGAWDLFYRGPRDYSIPLGYKDLLVEQLAVGDFLLAEKRRERILTVFQEG